MHNPGDPESIPGNNIRTIEEDKNGEYSGSGQKPMELLNSIRFPANLLAWKHDPDNHQQHIFQ
jgi:hypothetical protein